MTRLARAAVPGLLFVAGVTCGGDGDDGSGPDPDVHIAALSHRLVLGASSTRLAAAMLTATVAGVDSVTAVPGSPLTVIAARGASQNQWRLIVVAPAGSSLGETETVVARIWGAPVDTTGFVSRTTVVVEQLAEFGSLRQAAPSLRSAGLRNP